MNNKKVKQQDSENAEKNNKLEEYKDILCEEKLIIDKAFVEKIDPKSIDEKIDNHISLMQEQIRELKELNSRGLPNDKDLNSITNFFLESLEIGGCKIFGGVLFILSLILIVIPVFCNESNYNKYISCIIMVGVLLLMSLFIYHLWKVNSYENFNTNIYYEKISKEEKKFLTKEGLVDDLIEYLQKGDEYVNKIMIQILAISLIVYRYYDNNCIIENDLYRIPYIVIIIGLGIIGVQYLSNSSARLKLLGVLQHFKVENIYK